jgi:hypothetical protein
VVRNSSIPSLSYFANLFAVGANGATFEIDGGQYTIVVKGMILM